MFNIKINILLVSAQMIFATKNMLADEALAKSSNCLACHSVDNKIIGPAFKDISAKYKGDDAAVATLTDKVKSGGAGV